MLKIDKKIIDFFKYLKTNGNIEKLGTNFDNKNEAVHRWFSFLPGFSHVFVKTTIEKPVGSGLGYLEFFVRL